jgi:hypothetical protein
VGRYGSRLEGRRQAGSPPSRRSLVGRIVAAVLLLLGVLVLRAILDGSGGAALANFFGTPTELRK